MNKISTWYKMYQFYNSIKLSVKKGSGKMKKKKSYKWISTLKHLN